MRTVEEKVMFIDEEKSADDRVMYYGKGDVFVFRTYATPLTNITNVPESDFTGRENVIFGMNIQVSFRGEKFLPSFTEGDNSMIIATDSMKNFILAHAAKYEGATMEGFLQFVAERFLDKYDHIEAVELSSDEIPYDTVKIHDGSSIVESDLVYNCSRNEYSTASVEVTRTNEGYKLTKQTGGISDLHLIKVSGSSFYGYIQDEYTQLPETNDRPLFIFLDLSWIYQDMRDGTGDNPERYVAAEQVRDIAVTVFHELYNNSIQHLINEIGLRVLQRFPQLDQIRFKTNNRTWEPVIQDIEGSKGQVHTEPRPPYGFQGFTVTRKDLENKGNK
ncbi:factor-independent urate hydroxylase [Natribacillus halophilus]|uniref:Uricase n=1 Tax=Natribacillus halophilus TaxID=549003 RepID=A0A1G8M0I6_9BACI|nr:urate oxidase [Natribacillus halophilus]SDI60890.1 urate oxidase [Natribacillus halophilus]